MIKTTGTRSSLLPRLAILLGMAAMVTVLSICLKQPNQGSSSGIEILSRGASTSALPGVGISIARMLSLDGTRQSLVESFSRNAPDILSTDLWVYCDMVPFYLGRLFKKSGASDSKLGINEALGRTSIVQRYGNLIGFVERFSLGVRNPTAFFVGALVISPECFFAGVCCCGLITLPV
ncbi:SNARE associated Golgi protein [Tanacetum coccineum]